jgi:hypothetical protein
MTLEAVVGEDAAQVGMIGKEDAEEVPGLALEPAGGAVEAGRREPPSPRRPPTDPYPVIAWMLSRL